MQLNNKFEIGTIYEFEFKFAPHLATTIESQYETNEIVQNDTVLILLILGFDERFWSGQKIFLMKCLWKNKVVYFSEQFFIDCLLKERKLL